MSTYGDNEKLLREYQKTKDIELRNQIVLNNKGLIYYTIKNLYIRTQEDRKELEQEGFLILTIAVENFVKKKREVNFSGYALACLKKLIKINTKHYNISLDDPIKSLGDESVTLQELIEDEQANVFEECEKKEISNNLKLLLGHEELKLIELKYYDGLPIRKIGKMLGISKDKVWRELNRIKTKLRGCKQFKEYKEQYYQENEISYLKATNFSLDKTTKANNKDPQIWATLFAREKREKKCMKNFMKDFKREIRAGHKNKH